MNYDEIVSVVTTLMLICGMLGLCVSVFTEFFVKKLFVLSAQALNIFVAVASIAITIVSCIVYVQLKGISVEWYGWLGFIVMGFLTATISMNGYDKIFSYIFEWINGIFKKGVRND